VAGEEEVQVVGVKSKHEKNIPFRFDIRRSFLEGAAGITYRFGGAGTKGVLFFFECREPLDSGYSYQLGDRGG
jgi:hypothetical protein